MAVESKAKSFKCHLRNVMVKSPADVMWTSESARDCVLSLHTSKVSQISMHGTASSHTEILDHMLEIAFNGGYGCIASVVIQPFTQYPTETDEASVVIGRTPIPKTLWYGRATALRGIA